MSECPDQATQFLLRKKKTFQQSVRSVLSTQFLSDDSLKTWLEMSFLMKQNRTHNPFGNLLKNKTFVMFFFSPSFRTRLSFDTAMLELGGHGQLLTPEMGRFKTHHAGGESIEDIAKVLSRYASGVGVRVMEGQCQYYGSGFNYIQELASYASIPVINMACDKFHPCQSIAEAMTLAEYFSTSSSNPDFNKLKKKKYLLTWGSGELARSWNSVQASLLMASRLGMDITIARPDGYDLDNEVYQQVRTQCAFNGTGFSITNDPNVGYQDADVVCSRHWVSNEAYLDGTFQKSYEIEKARKYPEWITTLEKMQLTNQALFSHPMPIDRNQEVTDEVLSQCRSIVYDIAENRLHVQKALLALLLS